MSQHSKLNQIQATAICGNDILSSTLYVSGITASFAGVFAPIILSVVALVLWLYKSVYREVVEALPVNGGAYNCLLNGSSKSLAGIAGSMTILSYVATAVISAKVGIEYLHSVIAIPITISTIALLVLFSLIVIAGIKDSAKVAMGIFFFHIATLSLFLFVGLYFATTHGYENFIENISSTKDLIMNQNLLQVLYLGFAASLLGISGFESSANFVEEQKKGVFKLTLRNMLIGVAIFNPLVALVTLNSLPLAEISESKDFLIADASLAIAGGWLQTIVSIDAFLVLSGAVLTSFIGVSGLMSRMSGDACLPGFLGYQNKKDSYPIAITTFLLLCISIFLITGGNLLSLAGVYTISFLGVMSLFGFGNIILKQTRTELKRPFKTSIFISFVAGVTTFFGIIGNIIIDTNNLVYFGLYFVPTISFVFLIIYQDYVLKSLLVASKKAKRFNKYFKKHFTKLIDQKYVAFISRPDQIWKVLEYLNRNETSWNVIFIYCKHGDKDDVARFKEIKEIIPTLQKAGAFTHFKIETKQIDERFSPEVIDVVSNEYKVAKNRIMIGSLRSHNRYEYSDLGGVRIIF